eukprot:jgi/Mesvir1/579/Mv02023-RA.3
MGADGTQKLDITPVGIKGRTLVNSSVSEPYNKQPLGLITINYVTNLMYTYVPKTTARGLNPDGLHIIDFSTGNQLPAPKLQYAPLALEFDLLSGSLLCIVRGLGGSPYLSLVALNTTHGGLIDPSFTFEGYTSTPLGAHAFDTLNQTFWVVMANPERPDLFPTTLFGVRRFTSNIDVAIVSQPEGRSKRYVTFTLEMGSPVLRYIWPARLMTVSAMEFGPGLPEIDANGIAVPGNPQQKTLYAVASIKTAGTDALTQLCLNRKCGAVLTEAEAGAGTTLAARRCGCPTAVVQLRMNFLSQVDTPQILSWVILEELSSLVGSLRPSSSLVLYISTIQAKYAGNPARLFFLEDDRGSPGGQFMMNVFGIEGQTAAAPSQAGTAALGQYQMLQRYGIGMDDIAYLYYTGQDSIAIQPPLVDIYPLVTFATKSYLDGPGVIKGVGVLLLTAGELTEVTITAINIFGLNQPPTQYPKDNFTIAISGPGFPVGNLAGLPSGPLSLGPVGPPGMPPTYLPDSVTISPSRQVQGPSYVALSAGIYRVRIAIDKTGTFTMRVTSKGELEGMAVGGDIRGSSYQIVVTPAPATAAFTTAEMPDGSGVILSPLTPTGLYSEVAGRQGSFLIVARDRFGNRVVRGGDAVRVTMVGVDLVECSLPQLANQITRTTDPTGFTPWCEVRDASNGTYTVTFYLIRRTLLNPTIMVTPTLYNEPLYGSPPFEIRLAPGTLNVSSCVAEGPALLGMEAAKESYFTVQSRDTWGNKLTAGGRPWTVTFRDAGGEVITQARVENISQADLSALLVAGALSGTPGGDQRGVLRIFDTGDGKYTVVMVESLAGRALVSVTSNGLAIEGSPFAIDVAPAVTNPPNCLAYGDGLRAGTAGESALFELQLRDRGGNNITRAEPLYDVSKPRVVFRYNLPTRRLRDSIGVTRVYTEAPLTTAYRLDLEEIFLTASAFLDDTNRGVFNLEFSTTLAGVYDISLLLVSVEDNLEYPVIGRDGRRGSNGIDVSPFQPSIGAGPADPASTEVFIFAQRPGAPIGTLALFTTVQDDSHTLQVAADGTTALPLASIPARAGQPSTLYMQRRDAYHNIVDTRDPTGTYAARLAAQLPGGDVAAVNATVTYVGADTGGTVSDRGGLYAVVFTATQAGEYTLRLFLNEQLVPVGDTGTLSVAVGPGVPDGSAITTEGSGLRGGVINTQITFVIQSRDIYGNKVEQSGAEADAEAEKFTVQLQRCTTTADASCVSGTATFGTVVRDPANPGRYLVTYTAPALANTQYRLSVRYDGVNIGGTTDTGARMPVLVQFLTSLGPAEEVNTVVIPAYYGGTVGESQALTVQARNRLDMDIEIAGALSIVELRATYLGGELAAAGSLVVPPSSFGPLSLASGGVVDKGKGAYLATFPAYADGGGAANNNSFTVAGDYRLEVKARSASRVFGAVVDIGTVRAASATPVVVTLKPGPTVATTSQVYLGEPGSDVVAQPVESTQAGQPLVLSVTARDRFRNRQLWDELRGGDVIRVSVRGITGETADVLLTPVIADNHDGTYTSSVTLTRVGGYRVVVALVLLASATESVITGGQFDVVIAPGPVSVRDSRITGLDGWQLVSYGGTSSFIIQEMDAFGNPRTNQGLDGALTFTVFLQHHDLTSYRYTATVTYLGDGKHSVTFSGGGQAGLAGIYDLIITGSNGEVVAGAPQVIVDAGPISINLCTATGDGVFNDTLAVAASSLMASSARARRRLQAVGGPAPVGTVRVGDNITFTVTARDAAGNRLMRGGEALQSLLVPVTPGAPIIYCTVTDHKDGTYTVSYSPLYQGDYIVQVVLGGGALPAANFIPPERVKRVTSPVAGAQIKVALGPLSAPQSAVVSEALAGPRELTAGRPLSFWVLARDPQKNNKTDTDADRYLSARLEFVAAQDVGDAQGSGLSPVDVDPSWVNDTTTRRWTKVMSLTRAAANSPLWLSDQEFLLIAGTYELFVDVVIDSSVPGVVDVRVPVGQVESALGVSPFRFKVIPSSTVASMSVLLGNPPYQGVAGKLADFVVQQRDQYGNVVMATQSGFGANNILTATIGERVPPGRNRCTNPVTLPGASATTPLCVSTNVFYPSPPDYPSMNMTVISDFTPGEALHFHVRFDPANQLVASVRPYVMDLSVNGLPIKNSPADVVVSPGDVYAPSCRAFGSGLTSGDANVRTTFLVEARDFFNNIQYTHDATSELSVVMTSPQGTDALGNDVTVTGCYPFPPPSPSLFTCSFALQVAWQGDGRYAVQYQAPAGLYSTYIKHYNVMIDNPAGPNQPFTTRVLAGAPNATSTSLSGPGASGSSVVGEPSIFIITPRDAAGAEVVGRTDAGLAAFNVTLVGGPPGSPPIRVPVTLTPQPDGSIAVQYTLPQEGSYNLTVLMNGRPISGSPVRVVARTEDGIMDPAATMAIDTSDYSRLLRLPALTAGEPGTVTFQAQTRQPPGGTTLLAKQQGGDAMVAWVSGAGIGNITLPVRDNGDGTYSVITDIELSGSYSMTVRACAAAPGTPDTSICPSGEWRDVTGSPFGVVVRAAVPAASTSYLERVQAESTGAVNDLGWEAGVLSTFVIRARDGFGNDLRSSLAPAVIPWAVQMADVNATGSLASANTLTQRNASGNLLPGQYRITDNNDGTYTVSVLSTTAGTFRVGVTLDGRPLATSPFLVTRTHGPVDVRNCYIQAVGAAEGDAEFLDDMLVATDIIAGQQASFLVRTRDAYGNPITSGGINFQLHMDMEELIDSPGVGQNPLYATAAVRCQVVSSTCPFANNFNGSFTYSDGKVIRMMAYVTDRGDGSYLFTYTSQQAGNLRVDVSAPMGSAQEDMSPCLTPSSKVLCAEAGVTLESDGTLLVLVRPGDPDGPETKLSSRNGHLTTARAGESASFEIAARDVYRNRNTFPGFLFTIALREPEMGFRARGASRFLFEDITAGVGGAVLVKGRQYLGEYVATKAGDYIMEVKWSDTSVQGSPFNPLRITPGASYGPESLLWHRLRNVTKPGVDEATGAPRAATLMLYATAGQKEHFDVDTWDMYRNQRYEGGEVLVVNVGLLYEGNAWDDGNGTYGGEFNVTTAGEYQLRVAINGGGVGRPQSLLVTPRAAVDAAESPGGALLASQFAYFPLWVAAGPTVAPKSSAYGSGIVGGVAGEVLTIGVRARDRFHNDKYEGGDVFEAKLVGPPPLLAAGDVASSSASTRSLLRVRGRRLTATFSGEGVAEVSSGAAGSAASKGSTNGSVRVAAQGMAGRSRSLLHANGSYITGGYVDGNYNAGSDDYIDDDDDDDAFAASARRFLAADGEGDDVLEAESIDLGNGTYAIPYNVTVAGFYELEVTLASTGEHIKNSPFASRVEIVPAAISPLYTVIDPAVSVNGSRLLRVGRPVIVRIRPHDIYGNAAISLQPSNWDVTVATTVLADGTIGVGVNAQRVVLASGASSLTVDTEFITLTGRDARRLPLRASLLSTWTPTLAGEYRVAVSLLDRHVAGSPFTIILQPGTLSAARSTVQGLERGEGLLEVPAPIIIQSRDEFGNALSVGGQTWRVTVVQPNGVLLTLIAEDLGDGRYSVNVPYTQRGPHEIRVALRYVDPAGGGPVFPAVGASPFNVEVFELASPLLGPHAPFTTVSGVGITRGSVAGEPGGAVIQARAEIGLFRDAGGAVRQVSNVTMFSGGFADGFEVLLTPVNGSLGPDGLPLPPIVGRVVDLEDGTYSVSYNSSFAGDYSLHIRYNGSDIMGSPYPVHIYPADSEPARSSAALRPRADTSPTTPEGDYGDDAYVYPAGTTIYVDIYPRDEYGNPQAGPKSIPPKTFQVLPDPWELVVTPIPPLPSGTAFVGSVQDSLRLLENSVDISEDGDGTYTAFCLPEMAARYSVQIRFKGRVIYGREMVVAPAAVDARLSIVEGLRGTAANTAIDKARALNPLDFILRSYDTYGNRITSSTLPSNNSTSSGNGTSSGSNNGAAGAAASSRLSSVRASLVHVASQDKEQVLAVAASAMPDGGISAGAGGGDFLFRFEPSNNGLHQLLAYVGTELITNRVFRSRYTAQGTIGTARSDPIRVQLLGSGARNAIAGDDTTFVIKARDASNAPNTAGGDVYVVIAQSAEPGGINDYGLFMPNVTVIAEDLSTEPGTPAEYWVTLNVPLHGRYALRTFLRTGFLGDVAQFTEIAASPSELVVARRQGPSLCSALEPPCAVESYFGDEGVSIFVRFDMPTNRASLVLPGANITGSLSRSRAVGVGADTPLEDCSRLFNAETLATLGDGARCHFPEDDLLEIILSETATVLPYWPLVFRGDAILNKAQNSYFFVGTAIPEPPLNPVEPKVVVFAPFFIGVCDLFELEVSGTYGTGGRPMTFSFALFPNVPNHSEIAGQLAAVPPQVAHISIEPDLLAGDSTPYEIAVTATNWMGQSTAVTHRVSRKGLPIPTVELEGNTTLKVYRTMELRMLAFARIAPCWNGTLDILYLWAILPTSPSKGELDPLTSRTPQLVIAPASLNVGVYDIRMTAWYRGHEELSSSVNVRVEVLSSSLEVRTEAPILTGEGAGFELDVSKSHDPDDPATGTRERPKPPYGPFLFDWACRLEDDFPVEEGGAPCFDDELGLMAPAPDASVLSLPRGTLAPGRYVFTITVFKEPMYDKRGRPITGRFVSTEHRVEVLSARQLLTLVANNNGLGQVSVEEEIVNRRRRVLLMDRNMLDAPRVLAGTGGADDSLMMMRRRLLTGDSTPSGLQGEARLGTSMFLRRRSLPLGELVGREERASAGTSNVAGNVNGGPGTSHGMGHAVGHLGSTGGGMVTRRQLLQASVNDTLGDPVLPIVVIQALIDREVDASDRVVLRGGIWDEPLYFWRTAFRWEVLEGTLDLDKYPELLHTPRNSSNLVIRAGALRAGSSYRFRLVATDVIWGLSGFDEISFTVNQRPMGGMISVSPLVGYAMQTVFTISVVGFEDNGVQPVYFRFTYVDPATGREVPFIPITRRNLLRYMLPPVTRQEDGYALTVIAYGLDDIGSGAPLSKDIVLYPPNLAGTNETAFAQQMIDEQLTVAIGNLNFNLISLIIRGINRLNIEAGQDRLDRIDAALDRINSILVNGTSGNDASSGTSRVPASTLSVSAQSGVNLSSFSDYATTRTVSGVSSDSTLDELQQLQDAIFAEEAAGAAACAQSWLLLSTMQLMLDSMRVSIQDLMSFITLASEFSRLSECRVSEEFNDRALGQVRQLGDSAAARGLMWDGGFSLDELLQAAGRLLESGGGCELEAPSQSARRRRLLSTLPSLAAHGPPDNLPPLPSDLHSWTTGDRAAFAGNGTAPTITLVAGPSAEQANRSYADYSDGGDGAGSSHGQAGWSNPDASWWGQGAWAEDSLGRDAFFSSRAHAVAGRSLLSTGTRLRHLLSAPSQRDLDRLTLMQRLLDAVGTAYTRVAVQGEDPLMASSLYLQVSAHVTDHPQGTFEAIGPEVDGQEVGYRASFILPSGLRYQLVDGTVGVDPNPDGEVAIVAAINQRNMYCADNDTARISSAVVSFRLVDPVTAAGMNVSVAEGTSIQLQIPVNRLTGSTCRIQRGSCRFWDVSTASWSSDGLFTKERTANVVVCETKHLSVFGVSSEDVTPRFNPVRPVFSSELFSHVKPENATALYVLGAILLCYVAANLAGYRKDVRDRRKERLTEKIAVLDARLASMAAPSGSGAPAAVGGAFSDPLANGGGAKDREGMNGLDGPGLPTANDGGGGNGNGLLQPPPRVALNGAAGIGGQGLIIETGKKPHSWWGKVERAIRLHHLIGRTIYIEPASKYTRPQRLTVLLCVVLGHFAVTAIFFGVNPSNLTAKVIVAVAAAILLFPSEVLFSFVFQKSVVMPLPRKLKHRPPLPRSKPPKEKEEPREPAAKPPVPPSRPSLPLMVPLSPGTPGTPVPPVPPMLGPARTTPDGIPLPPIGATRRPSRKPSGRPGAPVPPPPLPPFGYGMPPPMGGRPMPMAPPPPPMPPAEGERVRPRRRVGAAPSVTGISTTGASYQTSMRDGLWAPVNPMGPPGMPPPPRLAPGQPPPPPTSGVPRPMRANARPPSVRSRGGSAMGAPLPAFTSPPPPPGALFPPPLPPPGAAGVARPPLSRFRRALARAVPGQPPAQSNRVAPMPALLPAFGGPPGFPPPAFPQSPIPGGPPPPPPPTGGMMRPRRRTSAASSRSGAPPFYEPNQYAVPGTLRMAAGQQALPLSFGINPQAYAEAAMRLRRPGGQRHSQYGAHLRAAAGIDPSSPSAQLSRFLQEGGYVPEALDSVVIIIQRAWRRKAAQLRRRRRVAATKIQAAWRGYITRQHIRERREAEDKGRPVQGLWWVSAHSHKAQKQEGPQGASEVLMSKRRADAPGQWARRSATGGGSALDGRGPGFSRLRPRIRSREAELAELQRRRKLKQMQKSRKGLPRWFIYVAYAGCFLFCAFCCYFIVLYALVFEPPITRAWLLAAALSLVIEVFLCDPLKNVAIASLKARVKQRMREYRAHREEKRRSRQFSASNGAGGGKNGGGEGGGRDGGGGSPGADPQPVAERSVAPGQSFRR